MNYCIILAGGKGQRLWPLSRLGRPKQFLDLFSTGKTLLQQTFARMCRTFPKENIYISTYKGYETFVREQLPEVDEEHLLCEPVQLSTAPAVRWASLHIYRRDADSNVMVMPADALILDEAAFDKVVAEGITFAASHPQFLVIGAKPTSPNVYYGYIQKSEATEAPDIYHVKAFTEKPDIDFARMFVESGEFVWNTSIFFWNATTMLNQLRRLMPPELMGRIDSQLAPMTREEELALMEKYFPVSLHSSLDFSILRNEELVCVKEASFGWADIGGWPDVREAGKKDFDGNVVLSSSQVILRNCKENVIVLPEGVKAVIQDLTGYLVAYHDGILFICPDGEPNMVRRIVGNVQMQFGNDAV